MSGWLIDLLFIVCSKIFHLYDDINDAKHRTLIGAYGIWKGEILLTWLAFCDTGLPVCGVIRRAVKFSLLSQTSKGHWIRISIGIPKYDLDTTYEDLFWLFFFKKSFKNVNDENVDVKKVRYNDGHFMAQCVCQHFLNHFHS